MSASDDCRIEIGNINEQISKLEKAQKAKYSNPKKATQIQYFKNLKEEQSKGRQQKIKDAKKMILTITESLEDKKNTDIKEEKEKVEENVEKIANEAEKKINNIDKKMKEMIEKIINDCTKDKENIRENADKKIDDFKAILEKNIKKIKTEYDVVIQKKVDKIEDDIKTLEDKEESHGKYCTDMIHQLDEVPVDEQYENDIAKLKKDREFQIQQLNMHEQNERELNASFRGFKENKKLYFYQGTSYTSEAERDFAMKIDRDIAKKRVLEAEDDEEEEEEEKRNIIVSTVEEEEDEKSSYEDLESYMNLDTVV